MVGDKAQQELLGRSPVLLGVRVLRGALPEHSWSCRRFSGGIYLGYGESWFSVILSLWRNLPLAPFLTPMLDVAQGCTLMDYSAALREAAVWGPGVLQPQGKQSWSTQGCWAQQQMSQGGACPLCSIWGSLGYKPPSQVTLRRWRNSSGLSVSPVLILQLESLVLLEGWFSLFGWAQSGR